MYTGCGRGRGHKKPKKWGTPYGVRTPVEAGDLTAKRVLSPVYHPAHCIKACIKAAEKGALRASHKKAFAPRADQTC